MMTLKESEVVAKKIEYAALFLAAVCLAWVQMSQSIAGVDGGHG